MIFLILSFSELALIEASLIAMNPLTALEMIDGGSWEIRVSQVLPALSIAIAQQALEKSRNQDDGEVNRWLMEMFTQQ